MSRGKEIAPGMWEEISDPKPEWRYRCPKCKARVGEPCTYLSTEQKWVRRWVTIEGRKHPQDVQVIKHRAGDECVRSHNERLIQRHAPAKATLKKVFGPSPAVRALWDYDRLEYRLMQEWLRDNRGLFANPEREKEHG